MTRGFGLETVLTLSSIKPYWCEDEPLTMFQI